jgi:hypothetical protein
MGRKCGNVVTVYVNVSVSVSDEWHGNTHLMKLVRACIDMPSWSRTLIRWGTKSRKDIAYPFRGAIKSLGSTMDGSGLLCIRINDQVMRGIALTQLRNITPS